MGSWQWAKAQAKAKACWAGCARQAGQLCNCATGHTALRCARIATVFMPLKRAALAGKL